MKLTKFSPEVAAILYSLVERVTDLESPEPTEAKPRSDRKSRDKQSASQRRSKRQNLSA
jgi:hypothetical protein